MSQRTASIISLTVFALAAAYLIVYYIPALRRVKEYMPERAMETPIAFVKSVAASIPLARTSADNPSTAFKDAMMFARSADGAPRIVINRA